MSKESQTTRSAHEAPACGLLTAPPCSADFCPASLHLRYLNLRIHPDFYLTHNYIVSDAIGIDAGSIGFRNGMSVFVDNFPLQKKYYRQDIPIRTWSEFESDIARVGLPLVLPNVKAHSQPQGA
jgi:hypothetical protein